MSLPSIQEIISLYLYGQSTKPSSADLLSDQWIRSRAIDEVSILNAPPDGRKIIITPEVTNGTTITLDQTEYMTIGPGRFATPEKFLLVNKFLNGDGNIPAGSYVLSSSTNLPSPPPDIFLKDYGYTEANRVSTIYQYVMGVMDPDFSERAYIHGSTAFKITGGNFIVYPDGSR
jgi:hypothetical protein